MASELADFQDHVVAALLARADGDATESPLGHVAMRVHRNSIRAAAINALAANFPSVVDELGAEQFRMAARDHFQRQPPVDPRLVVYGDGFPGFLASAGAARAAALARLDRAWIESHLALDAEALLVAAAGVEQLATLRVRPHPATRWPAADAAIAAHWARVRGITLAAASDESDRTLVFTRPAGVVIVTPGSSALARLLDALDADPCLLDAATSVMSADPTLDIGGAFARLLAAGALVADHRTGGDA